MKFLIIHVVNMFIRVQENFKQASFHLGEAYIFFFSVVSLSADKYQC